MSGQYHNALYTGDVEERIKILKTLGQGTCIFIKLEFPPPPPPWKKNLDIMNMVKAWLNMISFSGH